MSTQDWPFTANIESDEAFLNTIHVTLKEPEPEPDDLDPARGIFLGVLLGGLFWAAICFVIAYWRSR